jgi:hypothetical protein
MNGAQTEKDFVMTTHVSPTSLKGWKITTAGRSLSTLSQQWARRPHDERYLSLDALLVATKLRAERAEERKIKTSELSLSSPEIAEDDNLADAQLKMNSLMLDVGEDDHRALTNWTFGQIVSLAGAGSASRVLKLLPGANVSNDLTYLMRYNRGSDEIKLYSDDLEALAVTGPDYGRIFDHEVTAAVAAATCGATGDHRWKVPGMLDWGTMIYDPNHPVTKDTTTIFGNDRGVFIFLCQDLCPIEIGKLPDGSPDYVFRGFYVTNSEVGAGTLKLGAMYLRGICCNRIMWGVEAFEEMTMRHTKYAPSRFIEEAQPALQSFANGSAQKLVDGVNLAKQAIVAETKQKAVEFLVGRNIAAKRALSIYEKIVREQWGVAAADEEPEERAVSVWDLAQGITAVAREEKNFDTRIDLEQAAGVLLDRVA